MPSSERPTGESIAAGPEERHETVRSEAFPLQLHSSLAAQIELTFRNALSHLGNRLPAKAFGDLVRISRTVPMTRRLAAYLVRFSLVAGTEPAAITLLRAGAEDGEGSERFAVRRQLARLFRRAKDYERARESLATILAEDPADRRARRVLNLLLEQEQRFEELDASLEKETREALRRGRRDRAAKALVARARLSARLGHAGQAALRYGQAAQHLEQARRHAEAFELRLQWLSALVASDASKESIDEANQTCRIAAERVNQLDRWKQLARKLGLVPQDPPKRPAPPPPEEVTPISAPEPVTEPPEPPPEPARAQAAKDDDEPAAPSTVLEMPVAEPAKLSALDARRQEAQFVAAGRWAELAAFYREQVSRAKEVPPKLEFLSRLAEVLEDELDDAPGAIAAYGEMVTLAGDARALREQLRLIEKAGSPEEVAQALATAVERAPDEGSRADLLTLKGERALRNGDSEAARKDFFSALRAAPRHLGAKVGLTEAAALGGEIRPLRELLKNPGAIPRKYPGRAELFRRLARLANRAEPELARTAWGEVFADLPQDEEARGRLLELARDLKDPAAFEPLVRAQLAKEPRGPAARKARIELVAALDRLGRAEDALNQLREAVKFEPGHKEAWLLLADRLAVLQRNAEAAWALEQAATATDDAGERAQTWDRLARFARDVLRDPAKAQVFARRAENARDLQAPQPQEVAPQPVIIPAPPTSSITGDHPVTRPEDIALTHSAPPPAAIPPPPRIFSSRAEPVRPSSQRAAIEMPPAASIPPPPRIFSSPTRAPEPPPPPVPEPAAQPRESVAKTQEVPVSGSRAGRAETQETPAVEMTTPLEQVDFDRLRKGASLPPEPPPGEVLEWDAPPAELEMRRRTEDLIAIPQVFDPGPETSGFVASAALKNHEERDRLSQRVHERPLDSEGYRALEMFFHRLGDERRAVLMREIADALEDRAPVIAAPDHVLTPSERAGLRHPLLRTEAGELLSMIGLALLKAAGPRPVPSLTREEFRLDSGRGARLVAEALLGAVRLLSIRAPDLFLSSENAPPVRCVFQNTPKLLIGRLAMRKELPEAQLRFFAARSLFAVHPELLALEHVPMELLEKLLGSVGQALRGGRSLSGHARALRDALPAKGRDRMAMLNAVVKNKLDLGALVDAAADSNNRAGLVAAGGVAPALQALKMLGVGQREIVELVRFASSERYLMLRTRSSGKA